MSKIVAKANRPRYLANVLSIAKIGGKVAATESLVLRSIIHRIGGTQEDLAAAGKLLGEGHYQVQLPDSLNERMDNLQDMIMVAIADGNLSPMEAAPIERMAKAMKYAQADVDLAMRRAKNALKRIGRKPQSITAEPEPPPIPRKTQQTPPPLPKAEPPPIPVTVKKEEEAQADAEAESIPELEPVPEVESPPELEPISETKPAEQSVEPAEVPEGPEEEAPAKEEPAPAERDAGPQGIPRTVMACMKCRAESENPETYCFGVPNGPPNPWGCRLANMPWAPGAPWMELGSFRDDATFVFDKHAIAERLTSGLAAALSCPHMDTDYTEAVFDSLPDRAVIGPRWTYRSAEPEDAHAVDVNTTEYIHGCAVSTKLTVSGVDPIGTRDAMKIIERAGRKA